MARFTLTALLIMVAGAPLAAVSPTTWVENEPKQIEEGKFDSTVSNNLGQIHLARQTTQLLAEREDVDYVHSLVQGDDGTVYLGTGPNGLLMACDGETVSTLFRAPGGGNLWALLIDGDRLLVANDGNVGVIYTIDLVTKSKRTLARLEGSRYVWAMAMGLDGTIYAATGPEGKLFAVAADGTVKVVYDAHDENLLCLAANADGTLYAGTDGRGLVLKIDPATGKAYVLYDAPEDEVGAIAFGPNGEFYVGTAAAEQAKPGRTPPDRPGGTPLPATTADGEPIPAPIETTATMPAANGTPARPVLAGPPPTAPPRGKKKAPGNAIYRIEPTGFVSEVFRESAIILAIAQTNGQLIVATGNEGRIYGLRPGTEEIAVLARLASSQAEALLVAADGAIYVGAANAGALHKLAAERAAEGTFTSRVLDADQVSHWGQTDVDSTVPDGTAVAVAFRSGNVEAPEDDEQVWSDWSEPAPTTQPTATPCPPARFLQYRLTLTTSQPAVTPMVDKVTIVRQEANHPPLIRDLTVTPDGNPAKAPRGPRAAKPASATQPQSIWLVQWKADDPNGDTMTYNVYFREHGSDGWILMAEDLTDPKHLWDTRTVPDGRYQIRLTAFDSPDNPPASALAGSRVSDPVIVDNTPPTIRELIGTPGTSGNIAVHATLNDDWTNLIECSYSIDSNVEWTAVLPTDGIFDSRSEKIAFDLTGLEPGEHRIAVRAVDDQYNTAYAALPVTVLAD